MFRSLRQSGGSGKLSFFHLLHQGTRLARGLISDPEHGGLTSAETELFQRLLLGSTYSPEMIQRVRPYYPQHYAAAYKAAMLDGPPVDGPVWTLDGADTTLVEALTSVGALKAEKAVLMLGSYTCPVFRSRSKQVLALALAHNIPLVFVYVYEAHVDDGWQISVNPKAGIVYNYPKNKAERLAMANTLASDHLQLTPDMKGVRLVVDHVDTNALDKAYEAVPVRIYTLKQGRVTFRTGPGPYETNMKLFVEALDLDLALVNPAHYQ